MAVELVDCLVHCLVIQMTQWLAEQMVQSLAAELVDCLVHCLVVQTVHCLAEQMVR